MSIISKLQKKGQETNGHFYHVSAMGRQWRSMGHVFGLWAVIPVYGPSVTSMCRYTVLWAVSDAYVPLY